MALLHAWGGESTHTNVSTSTSVAVKDSNSSGSGSGNNSSSSSSGIEGSVVVDGYDGLNAVAQQLASSRATSCNFLKTTLQHKLESLRELL